jgi:hypothetical protein
MTLSVEVPLMRKEALLLIETLKKEHYIATPEDIIWWRKDLHTDFDTKVVWSYIETHREGLEAQYPVDLTQWLLDFYMYLCFFLLPKPEPPASYVDWNLFFTLARPITLPVYIPLKAAVQKLNIAQHRDIRLLLKEECYQDVDLRNKVLKGEIIPAKYLEDMYPKDIKHYIEDRIRQDYRKSAVLLKKELARNAEPT